MNQQIKNYIDDLFLDAPDTKKMHELKEELYSNVQSRYEDILEGGASENEAYHTAVAGIGDVSSLFHQMEQTAESKEESIRDRKRSALITAAAIVMYILCIPANLLVEKYTQDDTYGTVAMFTLAAVATGLLIFNNMTRPKYEQKDDTIVEEFKAWNSNSQNAKAIRSSVQGIIWLFIIMVYLTYSFFSWNWHFSWIIFIAGAIISEIVSLIFKMKDTDKRDH